MYTTKKNPRNLFFLKAGLFYSGNIRGKPAKYYFQEILRVQELTQTVLIHAISHFEIMQPTGNTLFKFITDKKPDCEVHLQVEETLQEFFTFIEDQEKYETIYFITDDFIPYIKNIMGEKYEIYIRSVLDWLDHDGLFYDVEKGHFQIIEF